MQKIIKILGFCHPPSPSRRSCRARREEDERHGRSSSRAFFSRLSAILPYICADVVAANNCSNNGQWSVYILKTFCLLHDDRRFGMEDVGLGVDYATLFSIAWSECRPSTWRTKTSRPCPSRWHTSLTSRRRLRLERCKLKNLARLSRAISNLQFPEIKS